MPSNRKWIFGTQAGISFSPSPSVFSAPGFISGEGCASISDWSHNLILYSDGVTVWDGGGTVRATGLPGNASASQSAVILPDPVDPLHSYYVLTTDGASGGNNHFDGIRIDTTSWAVTPLSSLMAPPPTTGFSPTEKLCAIMNANGHDYWVVTVVQPGTAQNADVGPGWLRIFNVTASGVSHVADQSLLHPISDVGYMKATKGGSHIAIASMWTTKVLLMSFSNGTGLMDPGSITEIPVVVPPNQTAGYVYGVEFSPSAQLLYISALFPLPIASSPLTDGHVYQYALPNGPPVLVGTHPNNVGTPDSAIGALQLAPDGLIYIAQCGEPHLGVIANPDVPGTGCNVTFNALALAPGTLCRSGLPNHIRDLMGI